MKALVTFGLGMVLACSALAEPLYVSPAGKTSAAGTRDDPLTLQTAFARGATEIRVLTADVPYEISETLTLLSDQSVLGWDAATDKPVDAAGRERVVLKGTGTDRLLQAVNSIDGFTLAGLTLTRPGVEGTTPLVYVANCSADGMTITNCLFRDIVLNNGNTQAVKGGALYVGSGQNDRSILVDCVFSNISSSASGAALYPYGTTVRGCRFADCRSASHGGAIAGATGTVLVDCFFTNNVAGGAGGGVLVNSLVEARNCTFVGNRTSASCGGALYLNTSDARFVDCIFRDNATQGAGDYNGGGGAIYANGQDVTCTKCTFEGNASNGRGGAIYNQTGVIALEDCTFTDNASRLVGGGVFSWRDKAATTTGTVTRCRFLGNVAQNGGGLSSRGYYRMTVTDCAFIGNAATSDSGAIDGGPYTSGENNSRLDVTGCTFRDNVAPACAVGYSVWGSFVKCDFIGNRATNGANAGIEIFVGSASAMEPAYSTDVIDCFFASNTTTSAGRGLCLYAAADTRWTFTSRVRLLRTRFVDNYCVNEGSSSEMNYSACLTTLPTLFVDRCVFSGTDKTVTGGGLAASATVEGSIRNCLFLRNFSNSRCGAGSLTPTSSFGSNVYAWNCTFAFNNTLVGHASALLLSGDLTVPRVRNCIFWDNRIQGLDNWDNSQINANQKSAYYDCYDYYGKMSAEGHDIITGGTPGFVDVARDDLHLAKTSQLVDKGHNETWMFATDAKSLDGRRRVENDIVDFGCYEYRTPPGFHVILR